MSTLWDFATQSLAAMFVSGVLAFFALVVVLAVLASLLQLGRAIVRGVRS